MVIDNSSKILSESDDEIFEDASENFSDAESIPTLHSAMNETLKVIDIALNNKFEEAYEIVDKWSHVSLYHALGKACLSFLKAVLTLERNQIKKTNEALKNSLELCQKYRKQFSSVTRVIWRPNYNTYTDVEIHAELIYAESLLMTALITFLEDQNLFSLVKGAFRIRSCYQAYKECNQIVLQKDNWLDCTSQKHFESGVRMGFGTFNLMISHLPGKVLRLLEFVGFSGNRLHGFKELEKSLNGNGLRSPLALLVMLCYLCYIQPIFGVGKTNIEYISSLVKDGLCKYPNGAFFLLFGGRLAQLEGKIEESITKFNKCIQVQSQWKQLHNISYWELTWCHAINLNWDKSAYYAEVLMNQCAWSPATYAYQLATFLYMSYEQSGDENKKKRALELFEKVPSLRIRYAGKTVPAEKFAISISEMFIKKERPIISPALEFMYVWNIFSLMEKERHLLDSFIEISDNKLKEFKKEPIDNWASLCLIKAVCLKYKGLLAEAEESLLEIIKNEKNFIINTYLPPFACIEMGLILIEKKEYSKALNWLEKVRRDYHLYLLETIAHFRAHTAIRLARSMEQNKMPDDKETYSLETNDINESNDSAFLEIKNQLEANNFNYDDTNGFNFYSENKEKL